MNESPLKWWQQPVVILAHQYDADMAAERRPPALERLVRWKRSLGFEAEHLLLNHSMMEGSAGGDDPRAYLFRNRSGFRTDWLRRYLPVAQKQGLRVIVYFNVHWFKPGSFPADHFVVDSAGTPKVIYGNGHEVCPRGPFRGWAEGMAEDLGAYYTDTHEMKDILAFAFRRHVGSFRLFSKGGGLCRGSAMWSS